MSEVASLNIDLSLLTAKFNEGCARASKAMSDFEKSVKPIAKSFDKFGKQLESTGKSLTANLTVPILAAGAAIGVALNKTAAYGDEINNMSVRTGFSRESLQELKFAADQTGVSMDGVQSATIKLNKTIGEAASGNKKTEERFKQLGVSIKNIDGTLRPANAVFMDTVSALNRIPDETTRNAIGIELMGKGYGEIIPLVAEGKAGLEKFGKEARDAGLVMSEEAVIAADEFGDKMDKLKAQLGHAGMEIATAFMPLVEQLAGLIETYVVPALKSAADWFKGLSDTQKNWVVGIAAALAALGPLITVFGMVSSAIGTLISIAPAMGAAWVFITGPIGLVVTAIAAVVAGIVYLIKKTADAAGGFGNLWEYIKGVFTNLINYAKAAGKILEGVFTWDVDVFASGLNDFNAAVKNGEKNTLAALKAESELKTKLEEEQVAREAAMQEALKHNEAIKDGKPAVDALNISLGKQAEKLLSVADGFDKFQADTKAAAEATRSALAPIQAWADANKNAAVEMEIMGGISTETAQKLATVIPAGIAPAQQAILDFTGVVQSAMESTAIAVGEAVGAMVTGTGNIGGVLSSVMTGIADFVGNFGKAMIAASTAAMLAKAALATPASLAAGVALVGLSSVLKNVISKNPMGFAQGGLVMGETLGLIGEGRGTTRSNPEVVAPLDKLMDFMPEGGGGLNGQVEFIIQGETLRAVLAKNSSSRRFLGS